MNDDFDEDDLSSNNVIGPIADMRRKKRETMYYTVKEWKKFNRIAEREDGSDITSQEILLAKYNIVLTDYKKKPQINPKDHYFDAKGIEHMEPIFSKKELAVKIAKNFNMANFNRGMKIFNEGVKGFTSSIDAVTSQLGNNSKTSQSIKSPKNHVKIWSNKPSSHKQNQIKIWSDPPKKKRSRKRKAVQNNMDILWGKKRK